MKRISAMILSAMLVMCMFTSVVCAQTFTQENITVTVVGYDVNVTVTSEVDGTMTAHLYNEAKDTTLGAYFNGEPVVNNGVYTYNFNFELDSSVSAATLYIRVGNNVPATEKSFSYVSINERNRFFNELSALDNAETVENYLKANKQYTSADIKSFEEIKSDKVRTLVSEVVNGLDLATGYENNEFETDEYKLNKLSAVIEKEQLFNEKFAEAMECAAIADASGDKWSAYVTGAITEGLFDSKYYVSDGTNAVLTAEDVYPYFVAEVAKMSAMNTDEISKAFDRATLMAVKNKMAYGTTKVAFLYFVDKGTVVADMTNVNKIIGTDADYDLWMNIKLGTYTDCDDLVSKIVAMAATMVSGSASSGTTGGDITNSTSPGGFSGGSLSGGGSSAPATKPEEPEVEVSAGPFSDISSVDWAKESIEALAEKGVINGKSEGIYAPNDKVTREEFVKIIIGAFDLINKDAKADFGDVDSNRWSYVFIATANELGIVTGDGTSFNPTGEMSRQDMAVTLYRTAQKLGLTLDGDAENFEDADDVSDYAKEAVNALTAKGIINGMGDGTFAPKSTITRAQAAKVIYGLMKLVGGSK